VRHKNFSTDIPKISPFNDKSSLLNHVFQ